MRVTALVVLLMACGVGLGQTQFTHNRFTENGKTFSQDGSAMVANCLTKIETSQMDPLLCAAYITGIADLLADGDICIPPEVEAKRLVDVFLKYSEKHQELLHGPASRLVEKSLKEEFPCRH